MTLVYKCPGPHRCAGGTYSYFTVSDEHLNSALADGWFKSLPEAIIGKVTPSEKGPDLDEDAPPTRAELEAKAKEMGLTYPKNISSAKLAAKISEAIEANELD